MGDIIKWQTYGIDKFILYYSIRNLTRCRLKCGLHLYITRCFTWTKQEKHHYRVKSDCQVDC